MIDINTYIDRVDIARYRRAKELAEIGRLLGRLGDADPENIGPKGVVVLCYAVWEGFYNECISIYLEFLTERGGAIRDGDWMLLLGVISPKLDSLRDRNHSTEARSEFVRDLQSLIDSRFTSIDPERAEYVGYASNLNYKRLKHNYEILQFDHQSLQKHRIWMDRELVAWRNGVAHGDTPDLSLLDISKHVECTRVLLLTVSGAFQEAMVKRSR